MRIIHSIILIILAVFSYIVGREVFIRFDGELFSHGAVPIEYSCAFVVLLIGTGFTLGYLIKEFNLSELIIAWPFVHLALLIVLFLVGQVWELAVGLAIYSTIVLPVNLIGEGISLGFQANKIVYSKDPTQQLKIVGVGLVNVLIIGCMIYYMSNNHVDNIIL